MKSNTTTNKYEADSSTDNQRQQDAVNDILTNYDSDAVKILHQAQLQFNDKLKVERENDHRDYQKIEQEAKLILQRAHEEGEIHIVERHRKTPAIFYFSGEHLMVWSEGKISDLGMISYSGFFDLSYSFRMSEFILDIKGKKAKGAFASMITAIKNGKERGLIFWSIQATENNEFSVKQFYTWKLEPRIEVVDVILGSNGVSGYTNKNGIVTQIWDSTSGGASLDWTSNVEAPYHSLVLFVESSNTFYLIQNNRVRSVVRKSGNEVINDVLHAGQTGTPIDLAHHSNHNSLLVQDAGKREIGLHLLDAGNERIWRSFNLDSQITLPKGVFQSDETFTMSCLLKRNPQTGISEKPPVYAAPFKVWISPPTSSGANDAKLNLRYVSTTGSSDTKEKEQLHSALLNGKIPTGADTDWFLFTMQKEGDEVRFYVDGALFCSFQTVGFPSVKEKVLISMPGYFICELRVWKIIRTPKELSASRRRWLRHSEFEGLTGYWHLFVFGKENTGLIYEQVSKDGKTVEVHQEPDLSGNRHHLRTYSGENVVGDLNRETVLKFKARSPFADIIPLYDLKMIRQGLEIDDNTGKIYWIDEVEDGRICMMVGSVLGHVPPIAMFEINADSRFSVISGMNSPYQQLMIAHANRRDAMEQQMRDVSKVRAEGHDAVQSKHTELNRHLNASVPLNQVSNEVEHTSLQEHWLAELNRISKEEENALRTASIRRNNAIAQAKQMTDLAQQRVIEHRRKR